MADFSDSAVTIVFSIAIALGAEALHVVLSMKGFWKSSYRKLKNQQVRLKNFWVEM
jgi:hypothetical protein